MKNNFEKLSSEEFQEIYETSGLILYICQKKKNQLYLKCQ